MATILYAIIGMPLFLLYLSNIGDILAKSFKWIYARFFLCRICPGVTRRRALRERRKERARTLEPYLVSPPPADRPAIQMRPMNNQIRFAGPELHGGGEFPGHQFGVLWNGTRDGHRGARYADSDRPLDHLCYDNDWVSGGIFWPLNRNGLLVFRCPTPPLKRSHKFNFVPQLDNHSHVLRNVWRGAAELAGPPRRMQIHWDARSSFLCPRNCQELGKCSPGLDYVNFGNNLIIITTQIRYQ